MLNNIFARTLRDNGWTIFWYAVGLVAISFYLMYFFPYISRQQEILKLLDNMPAFIKNLVGDTVKLGTPEGFFHIQPFSVFAPFIFLIFSISKGAEAIAGENEKGTLDLLLSSPISRRRVTAEKFGAIAAASLFLSVVFWGGMTLASLVFSIAISPLRLGEAILSCFMFSAAFTALTMTLGSLTLKKKMSIGIVSGYALAAYLVNAYAPMVTLLKPYRPFSLFYYYNGASPVIYGLDIGHFLVLLGITILFFVLAALLFENRDLIT